MSVVRIVHMIVVNFSDFLHALLLRHVEGLVALTNGRSLRVALIARLACCCVTQEHRCTISIVVDLVGRRHNLHVMLLTRVAILMF